MAINLLIIEDSIDDMTLMQYHLRKAQVPLGKTRRVETAEEFIEALNMQSWDVIVSDFRLPRFDIFSALEIFKERKLQIPFIIVSGRVGEEAAAMALKTGAHDFVSKDNLGKLSDVVMRELQRAQERREKLLMEEQLRLVNMVFDNTSEAILITDKNNRIIKANHAFTQHTGYSESEVLGADPKILSSRTMPPEFYREMWQQLEATGHWQGEIINRKKSGAHYPEWLRINTVKNKDNELTNYIAVLADISERKKSERALIESNQKLQAAMERANELARQAQSANLAKRDFLANMSHEIRTPMHVIIGMAEHLQGSNPLPMQQDSIRMILESSRLLLGIINDVLDFSKIEAGALKLEELPFRLREIVDNLVLMIRPKTEEKKLSVGVDFDPNIPQQLVGDALRIKQVLLNLLSNAVKFTDKGTIEVQVKLLGPVENERARIMFSVKDTGIGMQPSVQARIFNPFEQADSSTTRRFGGSGLGLAISKRLIDCMHGEIGMESAVGQGSRFYFTLNLPVAPESVLATPPEKTVLTTLRPPQDNTILLVEDCEPSQILGEHLLKSLGFRVEVASNGFEAIDVVKNKPIDLVLMDVQMPELDGFDATRRIRADQRFKNLPIIAMTAHALSEDRDRCLEAGMSDYLPKPLDRDTFVAKINQWLSTSKTGT